MGLPLLTLFQYQMTEPAGVHYLPITDELVTSKHMLVSHLASYSSVY